ncbi:MAG TPA: ABC transporter permease [Anaerolineaceae bacterium]|jgi:ABC-2 type transport system permease protein|nr:ABC transporter permease [Anaerolineaceae bacterium]
MNRLWTIMRKELYHIWRDPRTLAMILALPALLLVLLGYGISGESRDTTLAVVDYSKSDASRDYINRFTASDDFEVVYDVLSEAALINLIDRDLIDVGILIPEDFARQLMSGQQATAQIYIDGSMNPTDSLTVQLKLNAISSMAAQDILVERVERAGLASGLTLPITGILKTLYNPNGNNKLYMIPGLIPILLQVQTLLLSALAIVREREQGTMEQLIVTPIRSWELMLGKTIPYLIVSAFNLFALLWLSKLLFGVTVAGSFWVLFGLSLVFVIGSLGMGVLISTISQSQMQAVYISVFIVLIPAIILSGLMFSRENMPAFTYWYSELLPVTQYLEITRGIIVRGVGPETLWWSSTIPLLVLSVIYFAASIFIFRKRI